MFLDRGAAVGVGVVDDGKLLRRSPSTGPIDVTIVVHHRTLRLLNGDSGFFEWGEAKLSRNAALFTRKVCGKLAEQLFTRE
jgi:hypothetical protein